MGILELVEIEIVEMSDSRIMDSWIWILSIYSLDSFIMFCDVMFTGA